MPRIVWDKVGTRQYESGLDRGVLYLPDSRVVPWNGLISVVEKADKETTSTYYDGMRINQLVTTGDFSATMTAVTYPDEFIELEGSGELSRGVIVWDQPPKQFNLSYRTKVGNDFDGADDHYRIHVIYNAVAIPSDKTYASIGSDPSIVEFSWELTVVPEEYPGFKPSAHIVIDSKEVDPWLLEDLEVFLYGSVGAKPELPSLPDLVEHITEWYRVKIIDNGDGTWTAIEKRPGFISVDEDGLLTITKIKASYLDDETYELSSTLHLNDSPQIRIEDRGDGTWIATTDEDNLITMLEPDLFQIADLDAVYDGPDIYHISDKLYDT